MNERAAAFYARTRTYYERAYAPGGEFNRCGWNNERGQALAYLPFLEVIMKPGTVLDLGCGNGMLLRFLRRNCPCDLTPHGVDFLPESIREARQQVLPDFAGNLRVGNVTDVDLPPASFTFVITSVDYVATGERRAYVTRCYEAVAPGGRLILYDYVGSEEFDGFAARLAALPLRGLRLFDTPLTKLAVLDKSASAARRQAWTSVTSGGVRPSRRSARRDGANCRPT
jgi:SAM-dependent methyltransferase